MFDKILQGYGRGMTYFTGRIGGDTKYVHTDIATFNASGASHPIQKLRVAMHTIIQRGADVHSLLMSYDKHAYGAVSGVLRITTMYDAITLMIERNLLKKSAWKLHVIPFLLSHFGTEEQEAHVHKMYPTEEGVEYGRFVEWATQPLPGKIAPVNTYKDLTTLTGYKQLLQTTITNNDYKQPLQTTITNNHYKQLTTITITTTTINN